MDPNKSRLLCPTVCCCPEIFLKDDAFIIKDDYSGEIKIPLKDIKKLVKDLDILLSSSGSSLDNKR
ncbi:MAG: hypothetical protein EBY39_11460 [Flavobacteriia bacterium]|nr:hypothetical protein [Flavobacteriia bacterium]